MKNLPDTAPVTHCIGCGGQSSKIGEIPFSYHFLDNQCSTPLDTGDLYKCTVCGLWFKYPYLSEEVISAYYKFSSDDLAWHGNDSRPDFAAVRATLIESFPLGGVVLDFGCYMGEFLNLLPGSFTKLGIEPSIRGAQAASKAGIQILGGDLQALNSAQFDAVTLFDVFEHLVDPVGALDTLFMHVRPGGLLCVVTGIANQLFFHLAGARYNYVCLPEHVCFLTKKFASFLSKRYQAGYQLTTLSRSERNLRSTIRAATIDLVNSPMLLLRRKRAVAKLYSSRRLGVIASKGFLPLWPTQDHALLTLHKSSEATP